MANRTKLNRNKGKWSKEYEKSKGGETVLENAEITNPGSLSSNPGQQNRFLQDQQNKEASRTRMKGEHVDENGGNVNEIN